MDTVDYVKDCKSRLNNEEFYEKLEANSKLSVVKENK